MLILINTPIVWLKFFRFLCLVKLIFDLLPLFNPYTQPLALVNFITRKYFKFWSRIVPGIYFGQFKYELYPIIAFEVLNEIIKILETLRDILIQNIVSQSF